MNNKKTKTMPDKKYSLSVVVATRNEEGNVRGCLESVKGVADEIVVVDEYSTDKTAEIAKSLGAKVFLEKHHQIFHITKQKALEKAGCDWILQLDADERVSQKLAEEIKNVLRGERIEIKDAQKRKLFLRHQRLLERRDGKIGTGSGEIVGYFIPRLNMFLGKPLRHAGVYPDGVIRLIKRGFARFPQKSVHEQIKLTGKVSWLENDLLHYDSPTLSRYFKRMNRYTDLKAEELRVNNVSKGLWSFIIYTIYRPTHTFLMLFLRHGGFLDGVPGFFWSLFSSLHFPLAYFKYIIAP